MKKASSHIILVTSFAILLIAALLLGGCTSNTSTQNPPTASTPVSSTPAAPASSTSPAAETPSEFRIGVMGGLTGPAAAAVVNLTTEIGYHFKYINEVEGGINGVKLRWKIVDDKGNPEGAVLAYRELRDSFKPQIYVAVEDYLFTGIKDQLEQDKAVIIATSAMNPQLFSPPGRYFTTSMPMVDGFGGYIKWVTQDWKGTGKPKIGVLHYDLPSGLTWKAGESWAVKQNVELVPMSYPYTSLDYSPQLLKLRDSGVNYIWMLGTSVTAPVAIKGMVNNSLKDKIKFTFNDNFEADVVLPISGKDAAGFMAVRCESPYSDNTEAATLYTKVWQWAEKKDKWADNRTALNVRFAIEAVVKQAVADAGKDKIDSTVVYEALKKLTNIDTRGNTEGMHFGPDSRIGTRSIKISQMNETGTGTKSISDFITNPRIAEGIDK